MIITSPADSVETQTMQAIVQTDYGAPDVLSLAEVARPIPQEGEVLVRVRGASVDAGTWHLMRGTPFLIRLIYGGLRQPKHSILGAAIAGEVAAVGKDVTQFQPGDAVFGDLSESGFGGFAEYVCAPASALASMPQNLTFEAAATVPVSGLAALQALRNTGQVQAGQRVLVVGASGGVGSFAVQLAKAFGADVVGSCRTQKVKMVHQLGADHVIDYTQTDITQTDRPYDLIVDTAAYRPFEDYFSVLKPGGTYVVVGGATSAFFRAMLLGAWLGKRRDRIVKSLTSTPNQADLQTLKELVEAKKVVPYCDLTYPLSAVPEAIRHLENRQVTGKVAITI
ncbi:MAG: NAD(P)-dependent alcohol dehydrogenase [Cyanobacteria bacterium P01_B01_bin.77]